MKPSSDSRPVIRDEISLADVALGALRFQRDFARLILPLAILVSIAAAALVAFRPQFEARAVLDTPKLSLDEWRRLVPILHDPPLVAGTLASIELDSAERERLRLVPEAEEHAGRRVDREGGQKGAPDRAKARRGDRTRPPDRRDALHRAARREKGMRFVERMRDDVQKR